MEEKVYKTSSGPIHYWVYHTGSKTEYQLVFLPGLSADHRLFDKQIEYFKGKYPILVWDAPGHASSYPFDMTFSLVDEAKWLDELLVLEGFDHPVIIGQSKGGFLGQGYSQLFREKLKGFIAIDSAPLQREYYSKMELWFLKRLELSFRCYPWKTLLKKEIEEVATSEYGQKLMYDIMMVYKGNKKRYAKLMGHGFKITAEAIEANLPYPLPAQSLLICGEMDKSGSCLQYNKAWHQKSSIPIEWIKGAGHNSNTDAPEKVNQIIEEFLAKL
ncbi:hypothetical protein PIROE2DRAFT_7966 [Piromyces sp. E2]|nr:hypothetical protein PIROE2DRAFT_7966 [Piromyces sp. E2]|eukprot:OUM65078.1 hypothetical protein PIROE2DRAFT_7966 [Piromyces sp. E2]